jgi:DNA-binding GntR family transcriptional regulator
MVPPACPGSRPALRPPPRSRPAPAAPRRSWSWTPTHLVQRDAVEQDLHVLHAVDGHAGLAHVAGHARVVAVVAAVGGEVERHRHALPAGRQRLAVEGVGFFGGGKARVLADRPRAHRIHGGLRAAQEGLEAGQRVGVRQAFGVGAVYSGLTVMPSGVIQFRASTSPPGADLAARPLREALKVLAAEGLVTMKVRRGAYVTEVSEKDLANVYHLLGLLEADAAAVVARTASAGQLAELRVLHAELAAATGDRERFFELNERFHLRLLEIADNRWRDQMVADLRKVMKLNRHNSLFKSGRLQESLAEHERILDALLARDADAAQARMREHFTNGLEAAV